MILVRSAMQSRQRIVAAALIVTVLISIAFAIDFLVDGFIRLPSPSIWPTQI